ncbi:MAG TPA: transporter substrate-binding domain-containing protein [Syntrophorhabdaceae bacterium]|nr:transporter substrate-binding domain-containing protein [Syntrophorhabdaceae bacterium]
MKRMTGGKLAVPCLLLLSIFIFDCASPRTAGAAEEKDTFRLVHIESFEPFAAVKDGRSEGLTIDILTEALSRVGLKVVFKGEHQDMEQDLVLKGAADGLAFFGVNAERKKTFDFSDPYLITGGALFVKSPGPPCNSLKELESKTIATPLKGPLAGYIKKNSPGIKLLTDVKDYSATLEAVLNGKADAAALNTQVGAVLARGSFPGKFSMPEKGFLEIPIGVAVAKGKHGNFLAKLNEGLKAIMADGTYDKIIKKWGVPLTTKPQRSKP